MKLSELGEFGLIDRIARRERKLPSTIIGIGDDAAVLTNNLQLTTYNLITTDTLIENVHFRIGRASSAITFFHLGRKAMAANISDISAMGGWPTHALVTIGLPKTTQVSAIDELYRGINSLARKHKIDIVGGDTTDSAIIFISITLLGEVEKRNLLLRSGAKVGDLICVTGRFGGAAASKFLIPNAKCLIKEARIIAKSHLATSMIDSSDGLVRSVLEICKASKTGARIFEDKIPTAKGATLDQALYGGEEYELVFTVEQLKGGKVERLMGRKAKIIGEIVGRGVGVKLVDARGRIKPLKSGGFEHFKNG